MITAYRFRVLGGLLLLACAARCPGAGRTATLDVDASDVGRRLFHSHMVLPVEPGHVTLFFPEWIPGTHSPSGQVNGIVNLKITAGTTAVLWRRDDVDMFTFRCDVPAGSDTLDVQFDFISPILETPGFNSKQAVPANDNYTVMTWESLLLYPKGQRPDNMVYHASLRLPHGWDFATVLPIERLANDVVTFKPVSLTRLIDSPVISGRYFRRFPLGEVDGAAHEIDVIADSPADLDMPAESLTAFRSLIPEAHYMFGSKHYGQYRFLLTLSEPLGSSGLEHHECTDIRGSEKMLTDPAVRLAYAIFLPHEYVHSWNGKFRRPSGLATADYQEPMRDELLWVYEGLTEYLGAVLVARSGLATLDQVRDQWALTAAGMDHTPGRNWRPLADITVAAQLTYSSAPEWASLRRTAMDFYDEGALIWLDADVLIRERTNNRKSLDDFCKAFFGGGTGQPEVKPYGLDDVVAGLNSVCEYDWKQFFIDRIYKSAPSAPLGGIERGGWKLAYREDDNVAQKSWESVNKSIGLQFSVGLDVSEKARVNDVIPGSAADKAGMVPGQTIISVNGRKYSADALRSAIKGSNKVAEPMEFIVESDDFVKLYKVDYHGGARNPYLQRDESRPDRLQEIFRAHTSHPTTAPVPKAN